MASKDEIQSTLKERFSINKNISQPLTKEECERLIKLLETEPSAVKLVDSYAVVEQSTINYRDRDILGYQWTLEIFGLFAKHATTRKEKCIGMSTSIICSFIIPIYGLLYGTHVLTNY